jgi:hypothetical protein
MLVRAVLTPPLCPCVGTDLAPTGAASPSAKPEGAPPPARTRRPAAARLGGPDRGNIGSSEIGPAENAWQNVNVKNVYVQRNNHASRSHETRRCATDVHLASPVNLLNQSSKCKVQHLKQCPEHLGMCHTSVYA